MRLSSGKVKRCRDILVKVTGEGWFSIAGDGEDGTRYASTQDQTVYIGGEGAASVLSYYLGVADAYGFGIPAVMQAGKRERTEAAEVLAYLSSSGRLDPVAQELGKSHARLYMARQIRDGNEDRSVEVIAYGDEVHLYEPGGESTGIVEAVAIGANLDVTRAIVTGVVLREKVLPALDEAEVHDHR